MRFHSPLDDLQLRMAARQYTQMRANLRELREKFPPRSKDERQLMKVYRDVIQEFAAELLKPRDRIDGDKLNDLADAVAAAWVRYMARRWR